MARQSKPKPSRVRLDVVLGVLIVLNVVLALRFSPIFSLRHVRVLGAQVADESMIKNVFETVKDTPVLGIKGDSVESSLQDLPEVDSATFAANIFGSGRVKLRYRLPIARIGNTSLAMSAKGEIWKTRQNVSLLPSIRLPASSLTAGLALSRNVPLVAVADLAVKLPALGLRPIGDIILDESGTVCLNRGDRGRIVLGGIEAMDEKLARLTELIHSRADLFRGPFEVNLTAPSHPVFLRIEHTHETADQSPS